MDANLDRAARTLAGCDALIALTGAGISVESGIPDFRSRGGLWERFDPLEYAHIATFLRQPEKSWELFVAVEQLLKTAEPNPAHLALAELERAGLLRSVITQNIDGLHQAAGNVAVREYHGSHAQLHCVDCGRRYPKERAAEGIPPRCSCGQALKPMVVLFGEPIPPDAASAAADDARRCDAMLVVGTSAEVYPAAAIPEQVARRGCPIVVIDRLETALVRDLPCVFLEGPAGELLPRLVERTLAIRDGVPRVGDEGASRDARTGGRQQVPG